MLYDRIGYTFQARAVANKAAAAVGHFQVHRICMTGVCHTPKGRSEEKGEKKHPTHILKYGDTNLLLAFSFGRMYILIQTHKSKLPSQIKLHAEKEISSEHNS